MKPNFTIKRLLFFKLNTFSEKVFLTFILFLFQVVVFAATNTYTGSNTVGGKLYWNTASNWSLGTVPTSSDDAVIPSGKTVILNVSSITVYSLTISGTLDLNKFADITINSSLVVVTAPNGHINFDHSYIRFPSNVALYLQNGSDSLNGSCNNNDEIFVGSVQYAVCTGGGALYLFDQIESAGGINVATAGEIGSSQSICGGEIPNALTSVTSATGSGTLTYEWQTNASGSYVTIASATSATYSPPVLSATASYKRRTVTVVNGQTFYSQYTSPVTITISNTASATGVASQSFCSCNNPTVSSLIATGTDIKWYSDAIGGTALPTTTALTDGTHYYASQTISGCESISRLDVTVTVVNTSAPTGSASQSFCSGSNPTVGSLTAIGSGVQWYTASTGGSALATNTVLTNGTHYYASQTVSGCESLSRLDVTAIVNSNPVAPTAGTPTNPTCTLPTGSVPLSGLPLSGTIYRTGSYSDASYTITGGGTQTISGLLPGTYNFAVSNGSCTSTTTSVTIIAPVTNTWSTGSWSNGTPTINQRLIFASDYTNVNDVDIDGCSCQVTGTSAVTIKSGRTLKIENGIEVMSGSSLTFENNASLVQTNDAAVNSGNINYHRHTAAVKRYDYTYWSSPVAGQTLKNLSPNTLYDKYYSYDNGWKIIYNGAATMTPGRGYLIRAPQTFSITVASVDTNPVFIGVPNNGVVSFDIAGNQTHLLGNPYPSAIDADVFLDLNSSVLEGTLYFWTHNSPPNSAVTGDATYNYTTSDYATYNRTGGVSTTDVAVTGGVVPTGKIAAGQGFFAPASSTGGAVVFNNSMRVEGGTSGVNNSQFFKLTSTAKNSVTAIEKNRIWLNLSNKEGAFKQTLVGYVTGATNDYDAGFDGITYDGNQFVDFYSVNQATKFSIQGRALPFVKKDTVVLGYKSTIIGDFQISIDHADGVLASQNVYLEDKDLQVLYDLKKGPYTFSTQKGVFNNRFVLRYIDKNAVEVVTQEVANKEVFVGVEDGVVTINSVQGNLQTIIFYDTAGRKLYQKDNIDAGQLVIEDLDYGHQVLLVDILLANGTKLSCKIMY